MAAQSAVQSSGPVFCTISGRHHFAPVSGTQSQVANFVASASPASGRECPECQFCTFNAKALGFGLGER